MRITYTGEQFFPELTMVSDYMYQKIYTPTVCILLLLLFLMTVDQVGDQIEHLGAKYNNECRAQEKKGFFLFHPTPPSYICSFCSLAHLIISRESRSLNRLCERYSGITLAT